MEEQESTKKEPRPKFSRHAIGRGAARHKRKLVAEQLVEIYENKDGSMPDMKHIEKSKRHRTGRAFVSLLLACAFLGAVAWAGFFFFQPQSAFSEDNVSVSLSGDTEVLAGQAVHYRFRYHNAERIALKQASLQIRYPEGFEFGSSNHQAKGETKDIWQLGTIGSGESGYIDITGNMFGNVGQKQSFRAFFNYQPENFHSEFQKVATLSVMVQDAPVVLKLSGATEVIAGANNSFTIRVAPKGDTPLGRIAVDLIPGDSFIKNKATPAEDNGHPYRWSWNSLAGEQTINLYGIFAASNTMDRVPMSVIVRGFANLKDTHGYVYASSTQIVKLVDPGLAVSLALNGTVSDATIHPGDILTGSVVVKNSGVKPQTNLVVRAIFDAPLADKQSVVKWSVLDDSHNGAVLGETLNPKLRRGSITWDARTVPALKRLDPGKEIAFDFHLPIKRPQEVDLSSLSGPEILAQADIQYGTSKSRQILSSNPIKLTFVSDVGLDVRHEVEKNSAGQETHAISWIVSNSFHELKNIVLTSELYGDIDIDKTSMVVPAGKVDFDQAKKIITWTIDRMPTSVDSFALQFTVVLKSKNPTQTQLSSKVKLQAQDTVAGREIIAAGDEVSLQN